MPLRYLATESVPVDALAPYPGNARVHDEAALDESAATNGQYRSVVARRLDGGLQLLAGHGTVNAFRRQGATEVRVEVIEADDTEARRIVLADNGTSRDATYDDGLLVQLLEAAEHDGGLVGTGWDESAYQELLDAIGSAGSGHGDPDDVDLEPPAVPVTRPGGLWLLGPHRLLCGDSTSSTDLDRLMAAHPVAAIVTDPPYGMGFDASWYGTPEHPSEFAKGGAAQWDKNPFDPTFLFALGVRDVALFGPDFYCTSLPEPGTWWVWDKRTSEAADALLGIPFELIWMNGKRAHRIIRHNWAGITARDEPGPRHHPTQKPVKVMAEVIGYMSKPGDTILDPFGGSGTTLIAATQEGRVAWLCEIDPTYCDVICRRYQEFTGNKPVLESTGEAHDFTKGAADDPTEGHTAGAAVPA